VERLPLSDGIFAVAIVLVKLITPSRRVLRGTVFSKIGGSAPKANPPLALAVDLP